MWMKEIFRKPTMHRGPLLIELETTLLRFKIDMAHAP